MRRLSKLLLIASVFGPTLAVGLGTASAGTIYVNSYAVPNDINVHSTYLPSINNEYTGSGQIILQAGPSVSGPFGSIAEWCTDLFHTLYTPAVYQTGALTQNGNGGALTSTQIGQMGGLMSRGNAMLASGNYTPGFSASQVSSAIQIAIWSVEYGSGYSFTSDDAALNGPGGLVATYVSNVTGANPVWGPNYNVRSIWTPDGQGLSFNQVLSNIPEPMSMALLASGLLGLGLIRRRGT